MSKIRMTREEYAKPIKCICGECGNEAWIMPFPEPTGTCLCSKCTFGEDGLDLNEMLKRIFCKKQENY